MEIRSGKSQQCMAETAVELYFAVYMYSMCTCTCICCTACIIFIVNPLDSQISGQCICHHSSFSGGHV